ncbi:DUF5590 domain-containing protein [Streptococcus gordonii]|uniref:cell wall elongation regulator TseB-like domain-containing protein n=1 Tax=Streptococcus gordonii TaxID=1302 RepID=UPI000779268B|nr:DUF5590 domain-containing protein [Streptococcus gordonii]RSJ63836.1 hypothetical protein D8807_02100 [Streptococcus gordonii]
MKNRRKRNKKILIWQYVIGIGILLTVLAFSLLNLFNLSMEPYRVARSNSIELARKYAGVSKVDSFGIYNGDKTYYSLLGETDREKKKAVLIEKGSDKIFVYELSEGTSKKQAEKIAKKNGADAIDKVTFGYLNDRPIWEVKSGKSYYIVDFEKRKLLSKEGL